VNTLPAWPSGQTHPRPAATIKTRPEDFRVYEIPLLGPSGEGRHLWLEVEKTGANTEWVARQLAACAGVAQREVGYAGMKDRHAVTRQWFSIGCQEAANSDWQSWTIDGVRLLSGKWHHRKLKRGALKGNRFEIRLRIPQACGELLDPVLERVSTQGVPNYFGSQRFGRGGSNVEKARRMFSGRARIPRHKRSLYLSAARSFLFNQLLAERVHRENWNRVLDGDVVMLDGRQSVFLAAPQDPELQRRCGLGELHPAGCLFGEGGLACEGEAASLQEAVFGHHPELTRGLHEQRLKTAWRSFRLVPGSLSRAWEGNDLLLEFELPAGSFATVVLDELVSVHDASISDSP
jgi:tRNA pseudouridine13 synthase